MIPSGYLPLKNRLHSPAKPERVACLLDNLASNFMVNLQVNSVQ